jgi:hypothetical protein
MNISKKITRKVPSSGARFWDTSIKGSLKGFKYLSLRKYKNFSTYLGTIITSLLGDKLCLSMGVAKEVLGSLEFKDGKK